MGRHDDIDRFAAAVDRLLAQPDADTDPPDRGGGSRSFGGFVTTRRAGSGWSFSRMFGGDEWPELREVLDDADADGFGVLAGHPHPWVRCELAAHPRTPPEVLVGLADDTWREVRAALVRNPDLPTDLLERVADHDPVEAVREIARIRRDGGDTDRWDGPGARCVECAARIKDSAFRTCSVRCSIGQYHRRVKSGLWADAIDVDYRHSTGLRRKWPSDYSYDVAYAEKTGSGVPGMGPRTRQVLISFVPGLTARQIARFAGDSGDRLAALLLVARDHCGKEAIAAARVEIKRWPRLEGDRLIVPWVDKPLRIVAALRQGSDGQITRLEPVEAEDLRGQYVLLAETADGQEIQIHSDELLS